MSALTGDLSINGFHNNCATCVMSVFSLFAYVYILLSFIYEASLYVKMCSSLLVEEEEERKLYFNNLLYIHQHTFFKYMIQSVIEGKNQKTNMSVYDIPL